ncbi:MAG: GH3 auxin-responsive promoter family protein [Marinifilaceae bacterium]
MPIVNTLLGLFTQSRLKQIEYAKENPGTVQRNLLLQLLRDGETTEYGKRYNFSSIKSVDDYRKHVPIVKYEDISHDVTRVMNGENNIFWPEPIEWFAKSSGTTDAKSKFIPISSKAIEDCHFRAGKDIIAIINNLYPDTRMFTGKTLALGGSSQVSVTNNNCKYGDLSAILITNSPFWANRLKTPDADIMLMAEWEEKLERICETTINQDVRCIAGVPSWFLMLINRILEKTGKSNLHEVWPNLEMFIHGGVNFTPYREQYRRLLPDPKMKYLETYNASEGFFGIQDDPTDYSMSLMMDYGVYYEFMPLSEMDKEFPTTLTIDEIVPGVNYALIITTNSGLWRYMIGDTVMFSSIKPFKFKITGRTKLYINAFGEELIIDNAIDGLSKACARTGAEVTEYTVAPVFMETGKRGAHQWLIEFKKLPDSMQLFEECLDTTLQEINSDYEAKRYRNMSLGPLQVVEARNNLFIDWMKRKGKLGGQNKVPRLWNDRTHMEELLELNRI